MTLREWRDLRKRAKELDRDMEPDVLAPPEAFSDRASDANVRARYLGSHDPTLIGPRSGTVLSRITSSCAGWPELPTTEEFYDAIRAAEPTRRQRNLIVMWMQEATNDEFILAWAEEVYTVRELVAAIHRTGFRYPERNVELNRLATT